MLKGHVFNQQLFGNEMFALFMNTFLAGHNGVLQGYKNGMALSQSGFNITIASGAICVQGRFLEEDSTTTVTASSTAAYARLVLEIDLDRVNTEQEFNQASFKIITDTTDYPALTQTDIVNNVSGVYQYSLARFQTSINGISNFVDERTFLDFDSIYAEIDAIIHDVEDGSIYALKEDVEEEFENLITVPIGAGMDFYGATAPDKYLFADGSAISRTEYAELYAIIGTRYGAGDGSTTFNLPDKRERVTVGYKAGSTQGTQGATMGTLGAMGGEFKHALTSGENGQHNHSITDNGHVHGVTDPGHKHRVGGNNITYEGNYFATSSGHYTNGTMADTSTVATGISIKNAKTGISINNSGSGTAHNNLQPYLVCNYIIRVK